MTPADRSATLGPQGPCSPGERTLTEPLAPTHPPAPLRAHDLRGLVRLGFDATAGVVDVVENVHATIAARVLPVGRPSDERTRGITGWVYGAVRGVTRGLGRTTDALWAALAPGAPPEAAPSPARESLLAALNGLCGDHLERTGNPLAIPMTLRVGGRAVAPERWAAALPRPRRLLLQVHGLCMSDLQWSRRGHDHGLALAAALGFAPLHVHYNSGRHVADNGADLCALLDRLLAGPAVAPERLVIMGHSMGGLVARSAVHQAGLRGSPWLRHLSALVFLGTPHHGAPLERGGHRIDRLLGLHAFSVPFARLGRARSAGITDLRFGNLQRPPGGDRHRQRVDDRRPVPLPAGVPAYAVAATRGATAGDLPSRLIGDGLVPLASALGDHPDPRLALGIPAANRWIAPSADHWDLLDRPDVLERLLGWLGRPGRSRGRSSGAGQAA